MVSSIQELQTVLLKPDFLQADGLKCVPVMLNEIIERGKRLDASYFDIESKKARQIIAECSYPKIPLYSDSQSAFISKVFYPGRFKRIYVERESGIPFISSSSILECLPELNCKYLSPKRHKDYEQLFVKSGWILISSISIPN